MAGNKLSDYVPPMLAREADEAFDDPDWIYEMKYDGYRALADLNGQKLKLYSRNGNSFLDAYPIVVEALKKLKLNALLDGEIIALDANGRSNFQLLQQYKSDSSPPLEYRVFDILFHKGKNLCELPLVKRKQILKKLLKKNPVVKYSDHIREKGKAFFKAAKAHDLEGIIAKEADSPYYPGQRVNTWLKIKNHKSAETIVVGFTEPTGSRKFFGSLILAVYENSKLRYVGHTGSGFTEKGLREIYALLKKRIRKESPLDGEFKTNTPATWVKPDLVAEIKYSEWTRDGSLRHPIFLRLRNDKKAKDVTMKANKPAPTKKVKAKAEKSVRAETVTKKPRPNPEQAKATLKLKKNESLMKVGKQTLKVSNLQKVYWPEEGFTKGDVIDYYQSVSKYILPYLKDRPESLKRNPNGIYDKGFFHKDAGDEAPDWVKSEPIYSESANKTIDYILCNDEPTLTYLNNLGCIEINPWHSTVRKPDHPDYLIIDIDPSDQNTFDQVVEAAKVVREILKRAGAAAFCKTSGSTGLHVYVPAGKRYTYEQLKDFAHLVCLLTTEELPPFTTLERNLKKRGNKHIYMDHLQNRRGQTISSVYSLRPKPGAPVSMPLDWKEVKPGLDPKSFNIRNALKRIQKKGDLFTGVLGKGLDLKTCLRSLGA